MPAKRLSMHKIRDVWRLKWAIKTVIPKPGGRVWYDDQSEAHDQICDGDDGIDYAFMGSDPNAADNQWLRAANENQAGVIYFPGIAPGRYQPIWPVYIADWDAKALKARRTARCAERIAAFQDLSRRLRCLPHRHRSRLSRPRFGPATRSKRRQGVGSAQTVRRREDLSAAPFPDCD